MAHKFLLIYFIIELLLSGFLVPRGTFVKSALIPELGGVGVCPRPMQKAYYLQDLKRLLDLLLFHLIQNDSRGK